MKLKYSLYKSTHKNKVSTFLLTESKSADMAGPSISPPQLESQISKESAPLPSSPSTLGTQSHHQHFATLTSLLKQQQCIDSDSIGVHPEALPIAEGEFSQNLQVVLNII